MKKVFWGSQAAFLLAVLFPLSFLPAAVGEWFGALLYLLWGSRRRIAIENVRRSAASERPFPSHLPEEIVKKSFRNLGRSFIEIVKIYYGRGDSIVKKTVIKGRENFETAIAKGKGVIFITGHCGNWELLAITSSFKGIPLSVVARPLKNPYLNKVLEAARARFGNRVIYKKGALREMISALKNCGSVGILMDQAVLPEEGYIVDFLGRGAWTTKAPALMARKTGAPILPAFIRRSGGTHEITLYPEVALSSLDDREDAVKHDIREFSRSIETYIRENPSEWLWLHRRWKRTPREALDRPETAVARGTA